MKAFVTPTPTPLAAPVTITVLRFVCIVFGDSISFLQSCSLYDRGKGVAVAKSLRTRNPRRRSLLTCRQCESVFRLDCSKSTPSDCRFNMLDRPRPLAGPFQRPAYVAIARARGKFRALKRTLNWNERKPATGP